MSGIQRKMTKSGRFCIYCIELRNHNSDVITWLYEISLKRKKQEVSPWQFWRQCLNRCLSWAGTWPLFASSMFEAICPKIRIDWLVQSCNYTVLHGFPGKHFRGCWWGGKWVMGGRGWRNRVFGRGIKKKKFNSDLHYGQYTTIIKFVSIGSFKLTAGARHPSSNILSFIPHLKIINNE